MDAFHGQRLTTRIRYEYISSRTNLPAKNMSKYRVGKGESKKGVDPTTAGKPENDVFSGKTPSLTGCVQCITLNIIYATSKRVACIHIVLAVFHSSNIVMVYILHRQCSACPSGNSRMHRFTASCSTFTCLLVCAFSGEHGPRAGSSICPSRNVQGDVPSAQYLHEILQRCAHNR